MQLRDPITTVSFIKTNKPVDPRFMGLLIATVLIAMICSSILISLLFQRYLVAAPIIVRGGQVYPVTSGGTRTLFTPPTQLTGDEGVDPFFGIRS